MAWPAPGGWNRIVLGVVVALLLAGVIALMKAVK